MGFSRVCDDCHIYPDIVGVGRVSEERERGFNSKEGGATVGPTLLIGSQWHERVRATTRSRGNSATGRPR